MLLLLVRLTICTAFYVIGAYATTDILRLLKGNSTRISASGCFCERCGRRLTLREQLPILAYLWNRGKCRGCGSPIPIENFLLEVFFTASFISAALWTGFSPAAWLFCVLFYEAVKLFCVVRWGKRGPLLISELCRSLLNNLVNFALLGALFAMHWMVLQY